jgi:foldase protein PrsA
MKKWILALALSGSVLTLGACGQSGSNNVAESKSGNVTQQELYDAMKDKIGTQALQQLIFEKVLSKKYPVTDKEVNDKVAQLKEQLGSNFSAALAQYGYKDEADLKKTMKVGMMEEKAALVSVKATDKELKDYYATLKPEITVRHILVKDEKTANEVKAKLDAGEKFADVAKKYSTDTGTAANGGEVGVINKDNESSFDAAFVKGAYALKLNEVSKPVKSSFGYHIIQVTKIKAVQPFSKMKKDIEYEVKSAKLQTADIQKAVKREMDAAKVKVDDKDLKAALDLTTSPSSSTGQ